VLISNGSGILGMDYVLQKYELVFERLEKPEYSLSNIGKPSALDRFNIYVETGPEIFKTFM
jgi:hypothetical protein